MTITRTTVAAANAETLRAATDHGYPIVWLHNVALVDVRKRYSHHFAYRSPDRVRFVSVHHDAVSYTGAADPGATFNHELARLDAVSTYHLNKGWGGIGYHTYGFPSGRLYLVGDLNTQRANVAGRNHESIGHCMAGDFSTSLPAIALQLVTAMAALACWKHLGRLVAVQPHRAVALASSPTSCPGDTYAQWMPHLPRAIEAIARQRAE